jgi:hypothetical protein
MHVARRYGVPSLPHPGMEHSHDWSQDRVTIKFAIPGGSLTKAFERFLRSFSDDDLTAYAQEQLESRPPFRRVMEVAVRIELDRRGLDLGGIDEPGSFPDTPGPPQGGSAETTDRR